MKIFSEDIFLLKELQISNTIDVYLLHDKFKISPSQLSRSVNKFEENKIIEVEENLISLTEFGKNWLLANRNFIYLEKRAYIWGNSEDLVKDKLEINTPFNPNKKSIDKRIYKLIEGEK